MILRALAAVLVLLVAAACAAGCGEDQEVEYRRELRVIGADVARAIDAVPAEGDEPIAPRQVKRLAQELDDAADDVDGLDPPADARAAQVRFERGLRGVSRALAKLARDLERMPDEGDQAERFVEFAGDERIERSFDDLVAAQEAYARAGYRVFARD